MKRNFSGNKFITVYNTKDDVEYNCPIKGDFHKSIYGCFWDENNNHIYRKIPVTRNIKGQLITDIIDFKTEYSSFTLKDGRVTWITKILESYTQLDKVLTNGIKVKSFFTKILDDYFKKIQPILGDEYISPRHLFDIVVVNSELINLRPILLSSSFQEFLGDLRASFFHIFNMYIKNADDEMSVCFKEKLICSVKTFTGPRAPPEFQCPANVASACPHILNSLDENGVLVMKNITQTPCKFLLEKIINEIGIEAASSRYRFKCQFTSALCNEDESVKSTIKFAPTIFNRTTYHRLCVPNQFLNKEWLVWFLDLFGITMIDNLIV